MSAPPVIDAKTAQLLQRYGFEAIPFDSLKNQLAEQGPRPQGNIVSGQVEPPQDGDVVPLPPLGTPARQELHERGLDAIARGKVGAVILAGGMATRFGGVVKAAVPVLDNKSFLELKLADVRHVAETANRPIPVYLMASFATEEALKELAERSTSPLTPTEVFAQFISLRLTPEGQLFTDGDGQLSAHAPGHGDLTFALKRSGVLQAFTAAGGTTLMMSNVDNLTATLDPAVIGAHLSANAQITAEMAPKEAGDKGGAPGRVDGKLQIIESFRFPPDFDQDSIPVFNTNTLVLSAQAIDRDFPLTFFTVHKTVDDKPAVQFERLVGQLTAMLQTHFIRVERHGPDARFQPIKTPDDLEKQLPAIKTALQARGVL